jgi:hypothetical protein
MEAKHKTTILFAASILGLFLLNAPILLYFQTGSFFGFPKIVVYTYTAWLVMIAFYAIIIRLTQTDKKIDPQDE